MNKFVMSIIALGILTLLFSTSYAEDIEKEVPEFLKKPDAKRVELLERRMNISYDEITGSTTYSSLYSGTNLRIRLFCNEEKRLKDCLLDFIVLYEGFFGLEYIWILAGEKRYFPEFDWFWVERPFGDNYEWIFFIIDSALDPDRIKWELDLNDMADILSSDSIKVRFQGYDGKRQDIKLRESEIQSMRELFQYYIWVLTDTGEQLVARFLNNRENGSDESTQIPR